eukprot:CAMPEP_0113554284 /NCGR_PEP_ID=MMETSP0015_2-20120614/16065_1 /TAXON_ID=2838 /ORGANISM="Odontella" /LENGTH=487 /DNA_ID=CAMNT_0000455411 /DNA_START=164 /DNA_END=1627 /DNA_ORIENTATION=- /assembly_acc=CAM_ASM_000160
MASPSPLESRWWQGKRQLRLKAVSAAAVAGLFSTAAVTKSGAGLRGDHRWGGRNLDDHFQPGAGVLPDPVDGVCNNALPHAQMFDARPNVVHDYKQKLTHMMNGRRQDQPLPELRTLPDGSSFSILVCSARCNAAQKMDKNGKRCSPTPKGAAWSPDGVEVHLNMPPRGRESWLHREEAERFHREQGGDVLEVEGDSAGWFGFMEDNFGHTLHENLPTVAYMREMLPDHTKFLLAGTPMMRKLIGFIDPTFLARVVWVKEFDIVHVRSGKLTLPIYHDQPIGPLMSGAYNHLLVPYLRRWIAEQHPRDKNVPAREEERTVVFYRRAGTAGQRVVEEQHERDIIDLVHRYMAKYGFKGELVFFTGHNQETGELLSMEEQMSIYRKAKYIIGPHGSGLANVVWTDPVPPTCEDRVKILEFIPAKDSESVQFLFNGYYWVLGGMPVNWSQVTYAGNSTKQTTFVHIPDLENALDDMFGGGKLTEQKALAK